MKENLAGILKYTKIVLIVLAVISAISLIISRAFEFVTSVVFYYAAMVSFIIGFLSVSGNMKGSGNPHYIRSVSSSSSMSDSARESMKLRDSSFGFMIFMTIIGVLLMITSNLLAKAGM